MSYNTERNIIQSDTKEHRS